MTMIVSGALLLLGLTLLAVTGARAFFGGIGGSTRRGVVADPRSAGSARRILDERYAAGELSTEEYLHHRRVLEAGS